MSVKQVATLNQISTV